MAAAAAVKLAGLGKRFWQTSPYQFASCRYTRVPRLKTLRLIFFVVAIRFPLPPPLNS